MIAANLQEHYFINILLFMNQQVSNQNYKVFKWNASLLVASDHLCKSLCIRTNLKPLNHWSYRSFVTRGPSSG